MILAHGIGGRTDLPVPVPVVLGAAAGVLVVTFVALALGWRSPRLQDGPDYTGRGVRVPTRIPLAVVGMVALVVVIGQVVPDLLRLERAPFRPTIAPVTVWVLFWLVVPFASVVIGDWYTDLSPWRSLARLGGLGRVERSWLVSRVGVWPATMGLLAFAWLELVHPLPGDPATLGLAALVFTVMLLAGVALTGLETGSTVFDPFTIYNRLLSAISPLGRDREGRLVWRGWLRSLTVIPEWRGLWVFVVAVIGTVSYDGAAGAGWFRTVTGALGETRMGQTILGVGVVSVIGAAYYLAAAIVARVAGRDWTASKVAQRFAHTLVPIGLAYAVSHYFTLILFEGQQVLAAVSDPFGLGWDLFGTAQRPVAFFLTSSPVVWLCQSGFIVTGHLLGVVLAHDRSLHDFGPDAVRSQYAMLALMIALTGLGLLILAG